MSNNCKFLQVVYKYVVVSVHEVWFLSVGINMVFVMCGVQIRCTSWVLLAYGLEALLAFAFMCKYVLLNVLICASNALHSTFCKCRVNLLTGVMEWTQIWVSKASYGLLEYFPRENEWAI